MISCILVVVLAPGSRVSAALLCLCVFIDAIYCGGWLQCVCVWTSSLACLFVWLVLLCVRQGSIS